jgi:extradiol dioxygenase family protein
MTTQPLFHLAFPVIDLEEARTFYIDILGCVSGRESDRWIDFDFFGHQLVAHLVDPKDHPAAVTNPVDGHAVPASHFGLILDWELYQEFVNRLRKAHVDFVIEPYLRFEGSGESRQPCLFGIQVTIIWSLKLFVILICCLTRI